MAEDDFEKRLLTDGGKWWEFLDPETYQLEEGLAQGERRMSAELDWSRKRKRNRGPVGFGFFLHCRDCGNPVPPDFVFCVRCGGEPRSRHPLANWALVIEEPESAHGRATAVELLASAGIGLDPAEVDRLFEDPPVVVNFTAYRDQVAALVSRLGEIGVPSRSFAVDDPSVPWLREGVESLVRHPAKLASIVALAAVALVGGIWFSWILLVVGALGAAVIFWRELQWYRDRYHLDASALLAGFTGFDRETSTRAADTLGKLGDKQVREQVTVCLMEFYALNQQFRIHAPEYGPTLERTRTALAELMDDVLGLASRYARLDDYIARNPPELIRQEIEEARSDPSERAAQTVAILTEQLRTTEEMEASREPFRAQIRALATRMEGLRRRVVALRAKPSEEAWREAAIESALEEIELEFEVFEETFAVLG